MEIIRLGGVIKDLGTDTMKRQISSVHLLSVGLTVALIMFIGYSILWIFLISVFLPEGYVSFSTGLALFSIGALISLIFGIGSTYSREYSARMKGVIFINYKEFIRGIGHCVRCNYEIGAKRYTLYCPRCKYYFGSGYQLFIGHAHKK